MPTFYWNDDDIKKKLRKSTFRNNYLGGLLCNKYNDSPYLAITKAYPEKNLHPWEFVIAPNGYWQGEKGKENAIAALKWLMEEKHNIDSTLAKNIITKRVLYNYSLSTLYDKYYMVQLKKML